MKKGTEVNILSRKGYSEILLKTLKHVPVHLYKRDVPSKEAREDEKVVLPNPKKGKFLDHIRLSNQIAANICGLEQYHMPNIVTKSCMQLETKKGYL